MKIKLLFEVDIDDEGLRDYLNQYPDFGDESPSDTLVREAITAWDSENLLRDGESVKVIEL